MNLKSYIKKCSEIADGKKEKIIFTILITLIISVVLLCVHAYHLEKEISYCNSRIDDIEDGIEQNEGKIEENESKIEENESRLNELEYNSHYR